MKTKKRSEFSKLPSGDKALLIVAYTILGLFLVAIILPIIYIILASFIDPVTLQNSGLTFDFSKWTLTAYERVLGNSQIWVGFKNALIYSVLFTIISVVVTLLAAYPMSRADFKGRGFFNTIFVITMFFGGGLIPTYLLISNLGMLDTIWAILIPGAFSVWNMIIARTYYMGIPRDLQEAAEIDGANPIQKFFKVTLPGIRPVLIYVITITVLGGFAMFTESVALWQQSNPGGIGRTIVGYLYQVGITKANMGMASAVGLTLLALVLVVNLIQLVLMGFFRKEDA